MQLVSLILSHWIVIYLMDVANQWLNNWGQIWCLEIHLSIINFVAQNEILGKNGLNLVRFL